MYWALLKQPVKVNDKHLLWGCPALSLMELYARERSGFKPQLQIFFKNIHRSRAVLRSLSIRVKHMKHSDCCLQLGERTGVKQGCAFWVKIYCGHKSSKRIPVDKSSFVWECAQCHGKGNLCVCEVWSAMFLFGQNSKNTYWSNYDRHLTDVREDYCFYIDFIFV